MSSAWTLQAALPKLLAKIDSPSFRADLSCPTSQGCSAAPLIRIRIILQFMHD